MMAEDDNDFGEAETETHSIQEPGGTPAAVEVAPKTRAKRQALGKPETVKIILNESDDIPPTGLPIGYNGRTFMLQPGVEVNVPREVLNILNDAVALQPRVDPKNRRVVGWRKQLRFPYQVVL